MNQVRDRGLLLPRHRYYAVKLTLLLLALAGVWVGFSHLGDHWAQLGVAVALAVVITQIIFVSHDAAHRQIFRSARRNELVALILGTGIAGISVSWWQQKHSRHHSAPNQVDKDPDIEPSVVHFYPAEKPIRSRILLAMHARQGWWFYPLLVVEALNLQVQSVVFLCAKGSSRRTKFELALILLRLAALPALLFTLLPTGIAALFVVVQLAVTGVYLGAAFAVSHVGMEVVEPGAKLTFFERQVRTSRNVLGGRVASAAMGGLNYQIEHHLFPSMPRPNLRRARPLVREFCRERGYVYHEVAIHRAWAIVIRHLNKVGLAGRDAYGCPTASLLRV